MHLAFNIYWLWVFGTVVEREYGYPTTAALFTLLALGSSSLEFAFAQGGVGLSGVVYGLFGLLWILSQHDARFHGAVDQKTGLLFIAWFVICIAATLHGVFAVGNIAHGVGAALGILVGIAITLPRRRVAAAASIGAILVFGLWASTLGRPMVNLSGRAGYEEGRWGYDALMAHRNQEAVGWLRDAVVYQPKMAAYWYDMAIAYQNLDNKPAAIAAYRKAADQGEAKAQYYLGELYETGSGGLPKDSVQARYWYGRAAVQNNTETPGAPHLP
jgi:membrane associated rhomboid family serine protease